MRPRKQNPKSKTNIFKNINSLYSSVNPKLARRFGIYCLIFALFGVLMTYALFSSAVVPKGDEKTSAKITAVNCNDVTYAFSVSGQQYSFEAPVNGKVCSTPASAVGQTATVYYNPSNPNINPVVQSDIASGIIFGVICAVATLALFYSSLKLFSIYKKRSPS